MRVRTTALLGLVTVMSIGLVAAGCGSQQASVSSTPVIGAAVPDVSIPYWVATVKALKEAAKADHAKLDLVVANDSASTQNTQVGTLINEHVGALILVPVNSSAIVPSVDKANSAHIPVVFMGREASGGKKYTYVGSNGILMSEQAAKLIVKHLIARYGSPKGTVVDLEGPLSTSSGIHRYTGFMKVMKRYPNIHVLSVNGQFTESGGYSAMSAIIHSHPHIDAMFGANDEAAYGAVKALQAAHAWYPLGNPKHVYTVGIDGGPVGIEGLKKGWFDVVIAQHPMSQMKAAVKYAIDAIHHKKSPGHIIVWPSTVITPANVATVKVWGKQVSN